MKLTVIFTIIVVVLWITIIVLGYQIEGINRTALWLLFTPMVIVRLIRTLLLCSLIKRNKL